MIIVLVGPKGAGKSTIGRVLHAPPAVELFDIEALAKRVLAEHGGTIDERYASRVFEEAVEAIRRLESRIVIVESTAASTGTAAFFEALARVRPLRFVRVAAGPDTCIERIAARDPRVTSTCRPTSSARCTPAVPRRRYRGRSSSTTILRCRRTRSREHSRRSLALS